MQDETFDQAMIASAFRLAADKGWPRVSVAAAGRAAGLPLDRARERFPSRDTILLRFGRQVDQAALAPLSEEAPDSQGPVRDRLFDLLMRRIDALQVHRAGVIMLLVALPADPPAALLLACATKRSMRWMLDAAGCPANGLQGELAVRGLTAVWLWTVRAWERDESADLSVTMAALDAALRRAEQAAGWLQWRETPPPSVPVSPAAASPARASPSASQGHPLAATAKPPTTEQTGPLPESPPPRRGSGKPKGAV